MSPKSHDVRGRKNISLQRASTELIWYVFGEERVLNRQLPKGAQGGEAWQEKSRMIPIMPNLGDYSITPNHLTSDSYYSPNTRVPCGPYRVLK